MMSPLPEAFWMPEPLALFEVVFSVTPVLPDRALSIVVAAEVSMVRS